MRARNTCSNFRPRALSFTDWNGVQAPQPVGLANYERLLTDPEFLRAVRNTVTFAVESLAGGVGIALVAALALNQRVCGGAFFRTAYFLPVVTNLVAVGFLWRLIYHPDGLLNYLVGLVGAEPVRWLGNPAIALHSIVFMSIWQGFGYSMVLFLAALQTIPADQYEAAKLDGAGAWARFRYVTWPGLQHVLLFISITGVSGAFTAFAQFYVMTNVRNATGGPLGSTKTIMLYLLDKFTSLDLGYANAIGFTLFLFLLLFALLNLRRFAAGRAA